MMIRIKDGHTMGIRLLVAVSLLFIISCLCAQDSGLNIAIINIEPAGTTVQEVERTELIVQFWQRHLRSLGHDARIIGYPNSDRALERYNLLVVPGTTSLTKEQTEVILSFVRNGNSLILSEAAGGRITNEAFNRNTLANSLGLNYQELPKSAATSWKVMLETPAYLTASVPRLQTLDVESRFSVSALSPRNIGGFWIDPSFRDDDFSYWQETAAVVHGTLGRGNYVWMGFTIASVGGDLPNSEALYRFSQNIIDWLQRKPVIEKNPWPHNYKSALTFSMDTETAFSNINRMLQVEELPAFTLFILTSAAGMYHDLLRELSEDPRCELAVHGDSHDVFRSQSKDKQTTRLKGIQQFFQKEIGVSVAGFRPPEEEYDFFTLDSLVEAGYKYIFADNQADRAEPKIIRVSGEQLVQFPMMNLDDIKLIMIPGRTDNREIVAAYIKDINNVLTREGLYMANYHTHVLVNPSYLPVLREVAIYLQQHKVWVPTVLTVAEWWKLRHNVYVTIDSFDKDRNRVRVSVDNRNNEEIKGLTLSFWLPNRIRTFDINDSATQRRILDYSLDNNRASFVLPAINPLTKTEFEIVWQE